VLLIIGKMKKIIDYIFMGNGYHSSGMILGATYMVHKCGIATDPNDCNIIWPLVGYFMGPFTLALIGTNYMSKRILDKRIEDNKYQNLMNIQKEELPL